MKIPYTKLIKAMESNNADRSYIGFCLGCGEEIDNCESDTRGYTCDNCGEKKVYGAEEVLIMGMFKL
jgi:predicted RNA-binding Zn-ribbon protein involved in translation (DUF1610 family)